MGTTDPFSLSSMAAVVMAMDQPALLLDHAGRVRAVNDGFRDQMYHHADLSPDHYFPECLLPQDQTRFDQVVARVRDDVLASHTSEIFAAKIGQRVFELRTSPIVLGGQLCGFICQPSFDQPQSDLATSTPKIQYLLDHLDQGVWDYDVRLQVFAVSSAWRRMRGLTEETAALSDNADWLELVHSADREALRDMFVGTARGEHTNIEIDYRRKHTAGHWVWIRCRAKVVERDAAGVPTRIFGTDTDITQTRAREEEIDALQDKLQLALDAANIGVWEFDPNRNITQWDDRMLKMYGIRPEDFDIYTSVWEDHLHPDDRLENIAHAEFCQQNNVDYNRDYRIIRTDGAIRHVRSCARPSQVGGQQAKLIGVNIDVTEDYARSAELERAKAQLEHDSKHDALTGLANRRLLDESTLALADSADTYAVLHLDLDHFKQVNDTLGHAAGDAILVQTAHILRDVIDERGLICRIGGDEFAVLFEQAPPDADLHEICRALVAAVKQPMSYEGHTCRVGVSIGCALGHGSVGAVSDVFIQADMALYAAKEAGRNRYRMYAQAA